MQVVDQQPDVAVMAGNAEYVRTCRPGGCVPLLVSSGDIQKDPLVGPGGNRTTHNLGGACTVHNQGPKMTSQGPSPESLMPLVKKVSEQSLPRQTQTCTGAGRMIKKVLTDVPLQMQRTPVLVEAFALEAWQARKELSKSLPPVIRGTRGSSFLCDSSQNGSRHSRKPFILSDVSCR